MPIPNNHYGYNPFVASLVIPVSKRASVAGTYITSEGIVLPATYLSELVPSTKIYHTPSNKSVLDSLSVGGLKLFIYLVNRVEPGNDVVKLTFSNYRSKTGTKSTTTFNAAIKELSKVGIICPTVEKGFYFVNPSFLFSGNRVSKYPDKVQIKRDTTL
jgi:hypothetical protein